MRALLWPLFAWSAWAQLATVLAGTSGESAVLASSRLFGMGSASQCGGGTIGEGAALASVRFVGVGSASHCGDGHES
jgi:hypothetical protein